MVELKPCPFCGGADEKLCHGTVGATDSFEYGYVECFCGALVETRPLEAAIELWNTRATEARIAQLEAALAAILKVQVQGWENIWAGSNRCKDIARAALQNAGGSDGARRDDLDDGDDDDLESFLGDRP